MARDSVANIGQAALTKKLKLQLLQRFTLLQAFENHHKDYSFRRLAAQC
jgi:hypothetical protein